MKDKDFLKSKRNVFVIFGFLVGLTFPIGAIVFEAMIHGEKLTKAFIIHNQLEHPIFWFIESAPIVLGVLGRIIGGQRDIIESHTNNLESRLDESIKAETKLKDYFEALVKNAPLGIVALDEDQRIVISNKSFENIFGFLGMEIIGRNLDELIATEALTLNAYELTERVRRGDLVHEVAQRKRKGGQLIDVEISAVPIISQGEQIGSLAIYEDITEQKRVEQKLRESEADFKSLFDDSPISLWEEDFSEVKNHIDSLRSDGIINFREYFIENPEVILNFAGLVKIANVNEATLKLYQASSKDELFEGLEKILGKDSINEFREEIISLAEGQTKFESAIKQKKLSGEEIFAHLQLAIAPGYEDSWEKIFISITNITEQKEMEEKYKHLSFHDALTGLYNRAYFENEMSRLENSRQFPISIIVFDMDNLKLINDTKGHTEGDNAIRSAATLLKKIFRDEDMVARIGGDEFVVILPKTKGETVEIIEARIKSSIKLHNQSDVGDDQSHSVSFSMGIATIEKDQSLIEGYNLADGRMYEEKRKRKEKKRG